MRVMLSQNTVQTHISLDEDRVRKKDESRKSPGSRVFSPEVKVTLWRKSGRVWRGAVRDEEGRHQEVVSIWWKHVPSSHGPHTHVWSTYWTTYIESILGNPR